MSPEFAITVADFATRALAFLLGVAVVLVGYGWLFRYLMRAAYRSTLVEHVAEDQLLDRDDLDVVHGLVFDGEDDEEPWCQHVLGVGAVGARTWDWSKVNCRECVTVHKADAWGGVA